MFDLARRMVVKTRDVIFRDEVFPYNSATVSSTPQPLQVEIDWPSRSSAPRVPPDRGYAIFRSDRRLQASIHNPDHALPPRLVPLPPDDDTAPIIPPTPSLSPPEAPAPPRQSTRIRKAPVRYGTRASPTSTMTDIDTPKTWKQVLRSPHKDLWIKAADEEFTSLLGMKTWRLVPRPHK